MRCWELRSLMLNTTPLILAFAVIFAMPSFSAAGSAVTQQQMRSGKRVVEQEIDGVKALFMILNIREWLKGKPLPRDLRETHHIMVSFRDAKTGKPLNEGKVRVKVAAPDGKEQTKDLENMQWHFGADFELARKGSYGIMAKFKLRDGKVRSSSFWYEVK